jgi:hypothetical protein
MSCSPQGSLSPVNSAFQRMSLTIAASASGFSALTPGVTATTPPAPLFAEGIVEAPDNLRLGGGRGCALGTRILFVIKHDVSPFMWLGLDQAHEATLRVAVAFDVALGGGEGAMAGELLDVA